MPVTMPDTDDPEINIKNLNEYYNSLNALIKKYAISNPGFSR
jgi:hypothetical protein